jgi:hypothetical protein
MEGSGSGHYSGIYVDELRNSTKCLSDDNKVTWSRFEQSTSRTQVKGISAVYPFT